MPSVLVAPVNSLLFSDQPDLDALIATVQQHKPQVIIIDSIQNCYTTDSQMIPGSIGQLKESLLSSCVLQKNIPLALSQAVI